MEDVTNNNCTGGFYPGNNYAPGPYPGNNYTPGPYPGNNCIQGPYEGACLDQQTMNNLYADLLSRYNQLQYQQAVMNTKAQNEQALIHEKALENYNLQAQKHEADMELQKLKQEHEEKILKMKAAQAEGMLRRANEKENASIAAVQDSDGFFCVETTYSETRKEVSNPVLKISDLKLLNYVNCENGEYVGENITWDKGEKGFSLFGNYCTPERFMKGLEKKGEVIAVPEKKKKTIATLVYSYLIKHSDTVEIPARWGWNKTYSGWLFIESDINCAALHDMGSTTGNHRRMRDDDVKR